MTDPTASTPTAPTPDEIAAAKATLISAGFNLVPLEAFDRDALARDPAADPYPNELRDAVRGQVLALLSAETREGVRSATLALRAAVNATAPEEPARESIADRLTAFMDTDMGRMLTGMALQYMNPSTPPAPTPNLTVTGPKDTIVRVYAGEQTYAHRILGASGVLSIAVPKGTLAVETAIPSEPIRGVTTLLDFTEESHALDALVADANVHGAPKAAEAPKVEDVQ